MKNHHHSPKNGSAILSMLILVLILSSLSGTYLSIALHEFKMAKRTSQLLGAMNLAEAGAEEAIYAILYQDWDKWKQVSATESYRELELKTFFNDTGKTRVFINYADPEKPILLAEGFVEGVFGDIKKQIRMDLTRRGLFANGLTAKDQVQMNGNKVSIASYNSSKGAPFPITNQGDRGTVGSLSVQVAAVDIQNADILGFVATGGGPPSVGSNGSIRGFNTPVGVKVDPTRVTQDFDASFDMVDTPKTTGAPTSLPGLTIGTVGATTPTIYKLPSLSLSNNETLNIQGPVVLVVEGDIDVKGEININNKGSVEIYVDGDVNIGGNGVVNDHGVPADLALFGMSTNPGDQTIKLSGNGALNGVIYAPNADLELKGSGASGYFNGAAVANNITMVGNYEFNYDEALDDYNVDREFRIEKWRELILASEKLDFTNMQELSAASKAKPPLQMIYD